jgi:RNA polymerase sigma-70 factor (ECF subfamily)
MNVVIDEALRERATNRETARRRRRPSRSLSVARRSVISEQVERARRVGGRDLNELTEGLRPRVERMAGYYARRCGEDRDDLLQEAWVGLLDSLPMVDLTIGCPHQFLIQRARWRMLDAIKRARVRRTCSIDEQCLPDGGDEPAEIAVAGARVAEFLQSLSPVQRSVVEALWDGLTWREAGALLGCSSANIAYHVRLVRRKWEEFEAVS